MTFNHRILTPPLKALITADCNSINSVSTGIASLFQIRKLHFFPEYVRFSPQTLELLSTKISANTELDINDRDVVRKKDFKTFHHCPEI